MLLPYTPSSNTDFVLFLSSGDDAISGKRSCSYTAPLSNLLTTGGPPLQNRPGLVYNGASLILSEGKKTRGIWRPPRCVHQRSCYRIRQNSLTTEEYLWSILLVWRNYRKWKKIPKVKPSLRNSIGLSPGWVFRSAPEVARSSGVALTGPVVVDPPLIVIFWGLSVIPPHRWLWLLLWIVDFLLN